MLFDDAVWVERAVEEHDAFTAVLRSRSVEVLDLEDLLVQALSYAEAAAGLIASTIGAAGSGSRASWGNA